MKEEKWNIYMEEEEQKEKSETIWRVFHILHPNFTAQELSDCWNKTRRGRVAPLISVPRWTDPMNPSRWQGKRERKRKKGIQECKLSKNTEREKR